MVRRLPTVVLAAVFLLSLAPRGLAAANPLMAAVDASVAEPRIHVEWSGRCRDHKRLVRCHYEAEADRDADYDLSAFTQGDESFTLLLVGEDEAFIKSPVCWARTPAFEFGGSAEREFAGEFLRGLGKEYKRAVHRRGSTIRARRGRRARATFRLDGHGRIASGRIRSRRDGDVRIRVRYPARIDPVDPTPVCAA